MDQIPDIFSKIFSSPDTLASAILFVVSAFAALISAAFVFHWRKYGMGGKVLALTEIIYLVVCALLISSAFLSIN